MPYPAIDICCKCGKEINVKDYRTYRVRDDYRIVCVDCSRAEKLANAADKAKKAPDSRPEKKS
ncbi:MAG TPA: hypothetical protein VGA73_05200 [Candidatus Binatia bacterium]